MKVLPIAFWLGMVAVYLLLWGESAKALKPFETTKVGDNVYTFRARFHRTLFIVTKEGVIVGDPISTRAAQRMDAEIKKITDKPVKYVVYSHSHLDHASGGKIFKDRGARFISQARCLDRFRKNPSSEIPLPDITFDGRYNLELGGEKVTLHYFGPSHSDCLSFMLLPRQKLLFVVDIGGAKSLPYRNLPDTDIGGAIRVLKALEALPGYERVIPGHGPPTTPRSVISLNRRYLEDLVAAVKEAVGKGFSLERALREVKLAQYRDLSNYGSWLPLNIGRIYRYVRDGK